jgi:hypothetical protein
VFVVVGLIGILLFAWPTLGLLVKLPPGQEFSELYILGPSHTLEYIPFDVKADVTYLVYLGVGNHMGSSCYYTCFVKVGNDTKLLPNSTLGVPSSLPASYEYKAFIDDEGSWEAPLTFRVGKVTSSNGMVQLSNIIINGVELAVNQASAWDSDKAGYYYNFFVELWIYNSTLGVSQYHNRFVNLALNMTQ